MVVLRCVIKEAKIGYSAICLELNVVAVGGTPKAVKKRLEEAIDAHIQTIEECAENKLIVKPVPWYVIKKIIFDYHYWKHLRKIRFFSHPRKNQTNDLIKMKRMMPIGV